MLTSAVRKENVISTTRSFATLSAGIGKGMVADGSGNVYVIGGNRISKVTYPGGAITTFAGHSTAGNSNANSGINARFSGPLALAIDSSSNIYVADYGNNAIRKILATGNNGVSTISFTVNYPISVAVNSDASKILAVGALNGIAGDVYYYISNVDYGVVSPTPSYPLTTSVGYNTDGTFYRTPSSNNGISPGLLKVIASAGTSNQTLTNMTFQLIGGTTYNVYCTFGGSYAPPTYDVYTAGTNSFAQGKTVSITGFTGELAYLNISNVVLSGGTTTGAGGQALFQYNFGGQTPSLQGTHPTVTMSGPVAGASETTVNIDGSPTGVYLNNVKFITATTAVLSVISVGPVIYTLSLQDQGPQGTNSVVTSNIGATGLSGISNVIVKNTTIPELLYTDSTNSNVYIYAKQY